MRLRFTKLKVTACAEDHDTPYIEVVDPSDGVKLVLTDLDAQQLIIGLQRALSILPTSK